MALAAWLDILKGEIRRRCGKAMTRRALGRLDPRLLADIGLVPTPISSRRPASQRLNKALQHHFAAGLVEIDAELIAVHARHGAIAEFDVKHPRAGGKA